MKNDRNIKKPSSKPGLKMNELVQVTGVPKSTILHYLSEGLLPEPVRTHRNMAYYNKQCVNRIRLIRQMQQRHRLSLAEIKEILTPGKENLDISLRLKLNDLIFGPLPQKNVLDRKEFIYETGLNAEQLQELLDARLLNPLEADRFDQDDVNIGKTYAFSFSFGMKAHHLSYYVTLGEKIVDHEFKLRHELTNDLSYEEDAELTIELMKNARIFRAYILDRLFQQRVSSMRDIKEDG